MVFSVTLLYSEACDHMECVCVSFRAIFRWSSEADLETNVLSAPRIFLFFEGMVRCRWVRSRLICFFVMVPHLQNLFFSPSLSSLPWEEWYRSLYFEVKLRTPVFPQGGCVYVISVTMINGLGYIQVSRGCTVFSFSFFWKKMRRFL